MNLFGQLIYNDDAEYEIHNETGIINLSALLEGIYNSKEKQVQIKICKGSSILFDEDGGLRKKVDEHGLLSYHICGVNLELTLFNNTDEVLEFTIIKRGNYNTNGKTIK